MRALRAAVLAAALLGAASPSMAAGQPTFEEAVALFSDGNFRAAYEIAAPLATAGNVHAMAMLGSLYENGNGVGKDLSLARAWYEAAAVKGHLGAMFALSLLYLDGRLGKPDMAQGFAWTKKAADAGYPLAEHNLGLLFAGASGNPPDFAEASKWFRKAADHGIADAQYNLGVLYLEGKGVEQNQTQAAEWFKKAALRGLPDAMLDYGVLVYRGEGVQKNETIGIQWLMLAAQHGVPIAQNRLARLYANGDSDPVEAAKWHILARKGGKGDQLLDDYIARLTPEQIAEAEKRAAAFRPTPAKVQDGATAAKSPEATKSDPGG
jgi:TPR repeat protein